MRLLGTGELAGLKARGLAKLERDPILRNQRVREERWRAQARALIAIPPAKHPDLRRVELFCVEITRVAPLQHQLAEAELGQSLEPVAQGIGDYLRRCRFEYRQAVGPWCVRFTVSDDSPTQENP